MSSYPALRRLKLELVGRLTRGRLALRGLKLELVGRLTLRRLALRGLALRGLEFHYGGLCATTFDGFGQDPVRNVMSLALFKSFLIQSIFIFEALSGYKLAACSQSLRNSGRPLCSGKRYYKILLVINVSEVILGVV